MFELQSPSKYSPFDTTPLIEMFFHCSKQFLNSSILMLFSASAIFCFTSSTLAKHFPLRTFFIWGNKKMSLWVRSGKYRGWGPGVMPFLVKNCWTFSRVWPGALENHPSRNEQTNWNRLQKNSLKPNATSPNNTSWYTDTDGFPEYSPSEGSLYYKRPTLQEIIPGFLAPSLYT